MQTRAKVRSPRFRVVVGHISRPRASGQGCMSRHEGPPARLFRASAGYNGEKKQERQRCTQYFYLFRGTKHMTSLFSGCNHDSRSAGINTIPESRFFVTLSRQKPAYSFLEVSTVAHYSTGKETTMAEPELQPISPCVTCGGSSQHLESSRPEGRTKDIWRVVCECGRGPLQWSLSQPAAIRLWNRYMSPASGSDMK